MFSRFATALVSLLLVTPSRADHFYAVTLCQLAAHPEQYEGKTLRIRGRLSTAFEQTVLTDPRCDTQVAALEFSHPAVGSTSTAQRLMEERRSAEVLLIGVFHGPPSSTAILQRGYGHLHSFPMLIDVVALKKL